MKKGLYDDALSQNFINHNQIFEKKFLNKLDENCSEFH